MPWNSTGGSVGWGSTKGTDAVKSGLGTAKNYLGQMKRPDVPAWPGGQKVDPFASQQKANPWAGTGFAPDKAQYNGVGQSNDQIRANYTKPVEQAYQRGVNNVNSSFGANGLYGSTGQGMHSQALGDQTQALGQGLASANLAADKTIMQNEMNRVNSIMDAHKLAGDQGMNAWKSGLMSTNLNNQIEAGKAGWKNGLIDDKFAYESSKRQDGVAWDQQQYQNLLQLAGGGNPAAAAQMQADANRYSANKRSNAGMWSGIGAAAGGLLGNFDGVVDGIGSAWNGISNLFG